MMHQIGGGGAEHGKGSLEDLAQQLESRKFAKISKVKALTESGSFQFGITKAKQAEMDWLQGKLQHRVMQQAEARLVDLEQQGGAAAQVAGRLNEIAGLLKVIREESGVDLEQVEGLQRRLERLANAVKLHEPQLGESAQKIDVDMNALLKEAQLTILGEDNPRITGALLNMVHQQLSRSTSSEGPGGLAAHDVRSNTERVFMLARSRAHLCRADAQWPRGRMLMRPFALYLCMRRNLGDVIEGEQLHLQRAKDLIKLAQAIQPLLGTSQDPWERAMLELVLTKASQAAVLLRGCIERCLDPQDRGFTLDSPETAELLLGAALGSQAERLQQHVLNLSNDCLLGPGWGLTRAMELLDRCQPLERSQARQKDLIREYQRRSSAEIKAAPEAIMLHLNELEQASSQRPHLIFAGQAAQGKLVRSTLQLLASPNFDHHELLEQASLGKPERLASVCRFILLAPDYLEDPMQADSLAPLQIAALQSLCSARYGEGAFSLDLTEFCRVPQGNSVQLSLQPAVLARMNGEVWNEQLLTGALGFLGAETFHLFAERDKPRFSLSNEVAEDVTLQGGLAAVMHCYGFPVPIEEGHALREEWDQTSRYLFGLAEPWDYPVRGFHRPSLEALCDRTIQCGSDEFPVCSVVLRDAGVESLDWTAAQEHIGAIEPLLNFMHDGVAPPARDLAGIVNLCSALKLDTLRERLLDQFWAEAVKPESRLLDEFEQGMQPLSAGDERSLREKLYELLAPYRRDKDQNLLADRTPQLPALIALLRRLDMKEEFNFVVARVQDGLEDLEADQEIMGLYPAEDYEVVRVICAIPLEDTIAEYKQQLDELANEPHYDFRGISDFIEICESARQLNSPHLARFERELASRIALHYRDVEELSPRALELLRTLRLRGIECRGPQGIALRAFLKKYPVPCDLRGAQVTEGFIADLALDGYPLTNLTVGEDAALPLSLCRVIAGRTLAVGEIGELGPGIVSALVGLGSTERFAVLSALKEGTASLPDHTLEYMLSRVQRNRELLPLMIQMAESSGHKRLTEECVGFLNAARLNPAWLEVLIEAPELCSHLQGLFFSAKERYDLEQVRQLLPLCTQLKKLVVGVLERVQRLPWQLKDPSQLSDLIADCKELQVLRVGPGPCSQLLHELGTELPKLQRVRIRDLSLTDAQPSDLLGLHARGIEIHGIDCSGLRGSTAQLAPMIRASAKRLEDKPEKLLRSLASYHYALGVPMARLLEVAEVPSVTTEQIMHVVLEELLPGDSERLRDYLQDSKREETELKLLTSLLAKRFDRFASRKEVEQALDCIANQSLLTVDLNRLPTLLRIYKELQLPQMQQRVQQFVFNIISQGDQIPSLESGRLAAMALDAFGSIHLGGRILQAERWEHILDFLCRHPQLKSIDVSASNIKPEQVLKLLQSGRKPEDINVKQCFLISDAEASLMQGALPAIPKHQAISGLTAYLLLEHCGERGVRALLELLDQRPLSAEARQFLISRPEICAQIQSLTLADAAVADLEGCRQLVQACPKLAFVQLNAEEADCRFVELADVLIGCPNLKDLRIGKGNMDGLLQELCARDPISLRRVRFTRACKRPITRAEVQALSSQGLDAMVIHKSTATITDRSELLPAKRLEALREALSKLSPKQQLQRAARFYCGFGAIPLESVLDCLQGVGPEQFREVLNTELLQFEGLPGRLESRLRLLSDEEIVSFLEYAVTHYDARQAGDLAPVLGRALLDRAEAGVRIKGHEANAALLMGAEIMQRLEACMALRQINAAALAQLLTRMLHQAELGARLGEAERGRFVELIARAEERLTPFSVAEGPEYEGLQERFNRICTGLADLLNVAVEVRVEMDTSRDEQIARDMQNN